MKTKKVIIYDFDGTLGKTLDFYLDAYLYTFSKLKIKITRKEVLEKCFNRMHSEVCEDFGVKNLELFKNYYKEFIVKSLEKSILYPGVIDVLKYLKKKGYRLAIATMRRPDEMKIVFRKLDIEKYFDLVLASESFMINPKSRMYSTVLRKFKVKPEEVIAIGDYTKDIEVANKLKITSVLFRPDLHKKYYNFSILNKSNPDFIIKKHLDLLKLLK